MIAFIIEPFAYQYLVRAIWVCALIGGVSGLMSSFLMLRGWSLMGDALAHSIVPGVAISYLLGLPFAIGAFFAGLLASTSMMLIKQKTKLKEDVAIGLVFTGFLSIGLILASIYPMSIDLRGIILGNILAMSSQDVWQVVIVSLTVLVIMLFKWRELVLLFFDVNQCHSLGLSVKRLNLLFFTILSLVAVVALQAVGAVLVISMLVTPGATAYLLSNRFEVLNVMAFGIGAMSAMVGVYLSFFFDLPPGGFIVLLQTLFFVLIFFLKRYFSMLKQRSESAIQSKAINT